MVFLISIASPYSLSFKRLPWLLIHCICFFLTTKRTKALFAALFKLPPRISMINASSSSSRLLITALVLVSLLLPLSTVPSMAESTTKPQEAEEATVQIVFVAKPADEDPEAFHIRTLAAVLGSEKAAEDNVIYHYKHASSGFSAKLTKSQVEELLKQPGVLQVVPDRTLTLHGSGNTVGTVRPTRLL